MGEQPIFTPPPQSTAPEPIFVIRFANKDLIFEKVLRGADATDSNKVYDLFELAAEVVPLSGDAYEVEFDPEPEYEEFSEYYANSYPVPEPDEFNGEPSVGSRVKVIANDSLMGQHGVIIRADGAKDFDWIVRFEDGFTMPYDNDELEVVR